MSAQCVACNDTRCLTDENGIIYDDACPECMWPHEVDTETRMRAAHWEVVELLNAYFEAARITQKAATLNCALSSEPGYSQFQQNIRISCTVDKRFAREIIRLVQS